MVLQWIVTVMADGEGSICSTNPADWGHLSLYAIMTTRTMGKSALLVCCYEWWHHCSSETFFWLGHAVSILQPEVEGHVSVLGIACMTYRRCPHRGLLRHVIACSFDFATRSWQPAIFWHCTRACHVVLPSDLNGNPAARGYSSCSLEFRTRRLSWLCLAELKNSFLEFFLCHFYCVFFPLVCCF